MAWIGYVGAGAFAAAWVPQCAQTLRRGRCGASAAFLALSAAGSASLGAYAALRGDPVFVAINVLTTSGALLNLFVKLRPRRPLGRTVATKAAGCDMP